MANVEIAPEYLAPMYSQKDVGSILGAPKSTVSTWATGYVSSSGHRQSPMFFVSRAGRGYTVPFIGLAEAFVLNAFRKTGLPMQRIRPAVEVLKKQIGLEHALASNKLVHDGAEILYRQGDARDPRLIVVRNGNAVFNEVVDEHLKEIDFGTGIYAVALTLPRFETVPVRVDPRINGGRPTIVKRGVVVNDVLDRLRAGEAVKVVGDDFGLSGNDIRSLIRAAA